jgi:aldehyde dehydrogenase (NAD+)
VSSIVKDDPELVTRSSSRSGNYINGSISPLHRAYLPTENPFLGTAWALIARGNADDVNQVDAADRAQRRRVARAHATQRGHLLWKLGELVRKRCNI